MLELLLERGLPRASRVKFVRHKDSRYDLAEVHARGHFEAGYQAYRAKDVFNCDFIVSFLGLPKLEALFIGVYEVVDRKPVREVPWPEELAYLEDARLYESPTAVWYQLCHQTGFEDLEVRTVIDWGPAPLSWAQWASPEQDKAIVECSTRLARSALPPTAM